jgi:hypothetical protein
LTNITAALRRAKKPNSRLPDFCDRCKKPVDKRSIEIPFEQYQETQRQRFADIEKMVRGRNPENY